MPSEGRGILSPVRLPVPPLQQVIGLHRHIPQFKAPRCGCSCGCHLTLLSFAVCSCLRFSGFIAKFVEANGKAMDRGEVTLAMLGGDAE
jgi:hypothetical protein